MKIEKCPETGICSIIRADGKKVDLMPGEVIDLQEAGGDKSKIINILREVDDGFARSLTESETRDLSSNI